LWIITSFIDWISFILKTFLDVPAESILEYNSDILKDFITYQKDLVINGMKYYMKFIGSNPLRSSVFTILIILIYNG